MSKESAKEFANKMLEDKAFAKAVGRLDSREARNGFIQQQGYDFSREELTDAARELNATDVVGGKCCGATCESEPCKNSCDCIGRG